MIDRLDPDRLLMLGGNDEDVRQFIESDFKIRSGLCPNGHGLLKPNEFGQECSSCGFFTNVKAEADGRQ